MGAHTVAILKWEKNQDFDKNFNLENLRKIEAFDNWYNSSMKIWGGGGRVTILVTLSLKERNHKSNKSNLLISVHIRV